MASYNCALDMALPLFSSRRRRRLVSGGVSSRPTRPVDGALADQRHDDCGNVDAACFRQRALRPPPTRALRRLEEALAEQAARPLECLEVDRAEEEIRLVAGADRCARRSAGMIVRPTAQMFVVGPSGGEGGGGFDLLETPRQLRVAHRYE